MIDNNKQKELILFVISQVGSGNGGVESITLVIENLKKFQPIIITNLDLPINKRWEKVGGEVHLRSSLHYPYQKNIGNFFLYLFQEVNRWWTNNLYFYHFIRQSKINLVHFNDIQGGFQGIIAAKLAGAKVVFNIRDTKPTGETFSKRCQLVAKLSDKIIVLSKEMQTFIQNAFNLNQKQNTLTYIYSLVDFKRFYPLSRNSRQELRLKLGIKPSTFAIGYVASINPKKQQLELIEKMPELLQKKIPQAKLYLIGNFRPETDDYSKKCQNAVLKLKLENYIEFIGYCNSVEQWYQSLDAVIVVSMNEGLARCMIESLACGTPVVSFDVCSAREILEDNNCGKVVNARDYISIIDTLSELAENPAKIKYFQEQGLILSKKLFSQSNLAEYEDIYFSLLSKH